jgi:hypothetical protein
MELFRVVFCKLLLHHRFCKNELTQYIFKPNLYVLIPYMVQKKLTFQEALITRF